MKVIYRGDLLAPSGYGRAARAYARALITAGVGVSGEIHRHDRAQLEFAGDLFWSSRMKKVIADKTFCPIRIWHETPEFFEPDPTQYNIANTLWETSQIPNHDMDGNPRMNWVKQLNLMDEVWTSSEFCKKVFLDSGVVVPIHAFPIPIDLEQYNPGSPDGKWMANRMVLQDKLIFLSVFQLTKRKNPQDLVLAWSAEFGRQDDVALIVKTYGSSFEDATGVRNIFSAWRDGTKIPELKKNMHLVLDLVPEEEMSELYRMSDVFVLPSYGEGFGMPYQEAMACGKPVIYTDASSMSEFCVGYPVECDPEPVFGMGHIPWYNSTQNWWKVRVGSLRKAMRQAYDDWKAGALKARGSQARQTVERLHSHEEVGRSMRTQLEEVVKSIRTGRCRLELHNYWAGKLDTYAEIPGPSKGPVSCGLQVPSRAPEGPSGDSPQDDQINVL